MHLSDERLTLGKEPRETQGLVLMLHGGAERGLQPVDGRSLAYRRTRRMFGAIRGPLREAGIRTAPLRFAVKGWNAGRGATPSR